MNLEQLRTQAKELVKAARAGDADALERLDGREPILARAQLVVAREHGYPSWPALVAAAEASAAEIVRAATSGRPTRAEHLLVSGAVDPGRPGVAVDEHHVVALAVPAAGHVVDLQHQPHHLTPTRRLEGDVAVHPTDAKKIKRLLAER